MNFKNLTIFMAHINYKKATLTTIFEILGILYIWVTTLTFLGHVTSWVT